MQYLPTILATSQIGRATEEVERQTLLAKTSGDESILYGPRKVGVLVTTTSDGFELRLDYIARGPDNNKETDFVWSKGGLTSVMWTLDSKWYTENEIIAWAREIANEEGVPSDMSPFTWMPATGKIKQNLVLSDVDWKQAEPNKTYIGKIVDIQDADKIIQHLGRDLHIAHVATSLDRKLEIGEQVTINYDDQGFGKVVPRENIRSASVER